MMSRVLYNGTYDLALNMLEKFGEIEQYETVACVGKYEVISELLSALTVITQGEIQYEDVELTSCEEIYDKEYILSIGFSGITVYKIYNVENDFYYDLDDDFVYIHGDCSSKMLKNIIFESQCLEFDFLDYEDKNLNFEDIHECCDCDECCLCDDCNEDLSDECDDNMDGFNFNVSNELGVSNYSFYSQNKEMVEKTRQEILDVIYGQM